MFWGSIVVVRWEFFWWYNNISAHSSRRAYTLLQTEKTMWHEGFPFTQGTGGCCCFFLFAFVYSVTGGWALAWERESGRELLNGSKRFAPQILLLRDYGLLVGFLLRSCLVVTRRRTDSLSQLLSLPTRNNRPDDALREMRTLLLSSF